MMFFILATKSISEVFRRPKGQQSSLQEQRTFTLLPRVSGMFDFDFSGYKTDSKVFAPCVNIKMVLFDSKGRLAKFKLLYSGVFFYFQAIKQMTQEDSHTERKKLLYPPCFIPVYCPP